MQVSRGSVLALARRGRTLYLGGTFEGIAGQPRQRLAAVDTRTGELRPWAPRVRATKTDEDPQVSALRIGRDGTIYVGGSFASINNNARRSIGAVDANGAVTGFAPRVDGTVSAIALDPRDRVVYLGGEFGEIGGAERAGLAAVDAERGAVTSWNPDCDGTVAALATAPSGSPVYVAGEFASIGGKSRRGLAAVDARRGTATGWDRGVGGSVTAFALAPRRNVVYFGGSFESVRDEDRSNLAAVDLRTGAPTAWDPRAVGDVSVVADARGGVVAGGDFEAVGASADRGSRR